MDNKEVLKTLTIDEKLRLLNGVGDWHTYDCNGKVPSIMMTDGPHGIRKVENEQTGDVNASKPATCFPTASAVASTWNPSLAKEMAAGIAEEAKQEQISIVLGCGTNIKRSPLCGRNFEYFSEDPLLAGKMAASYIQGMQSKGIGTSLKHFAGNSQETRRMTSNSQIDERALREIYLSAFERAVKESAPTTVMCCYNRVNGDYGSHNRHLLTDILRNEWGYKGAVVSDWGATVDPVKCYKNGLTLEMPDNRGYHFDILKQAYKDGKITDEEVDQWAENILNNFTSLAEKREPGYKADLAANEELARKIEGEAAVLLKNNGVLPVAKDKTLIIFGEMAESMRFQGGGSSHINATRLPNALKEFEHSGYKVTYAKGYYNDTDQPDEKLLSEALKTMSSEYKKGESKILFFMGLTDRYEGEGYDRTGLDVPYNQVDLLERVSALADLKDVAVICFGGAPMDMEWEQNAGAILHMYLGGQAVDKAIVDLVSGGVNPSGKLAETVPMVRTDTPAWRYFAPNHDDVEYRESIFVGYRYYETYKVPVRYPFGFGLSYTKFEYSDLKVNDSYNGGSLAVSCTVTNVGSVAGKETVQLYILPNTPTVLRSAIELKAFEKIALAAGESKTVTFTLDERSFSVFNVSVNDFSVISGDYEVAIGRNIRDICIRKHISVSGKDYFRDDRVEFPEFFKEHPHGMDISRDTFAKLYGRELSHLSERKRGDFDLTCSFHDVSKNSLLGLIIRAGVGIAIRFMFKGKSKDDPGIIMVRSGLEEGDLEGLISMSGGAVSPKMAEMLVYAANRHHLAAIGRMFRK